MLESELNILCVQPAGPIILFVVLTACEMALLTIIHFQLYGKYSARYLRPLVSVDTFIRMAPPIFALQSRMLEPLSDSSECLSNWRHQRLTEGRQATTDASRSGGGLRAYPPFWGTDPVKRERNSSNKFTDTDDLL